MLIHSVDSTQVWIGGHYKNEYHRRIRGPPDDYRTYSDVYSKDDGTWVLAESDVTIQLPFICQKS